MAQYLAHPSGPCCVQGVKHSGTAVGEEIELEGIKCYASWPPNKSTDKILLFYCDVFGPWYLNNQLLMDFFAEHGYFVISPDYFLGDKLEELKKDEKFEVRPWITKYRAPESATALVAKFEPAVKAKFKGKGYATIGYCFGAQDVLRAVAGGVAAAGAVCHPAFLEVKHFEDLKQGAMFFSCAEVDNTFPAEGRHKAEEILTKNKQMYHFQLFSGVEHGFAIRGDPDNENERWAKEQSAWGTLGWFDRFLDKK